LVEHLDDCRRMEVEVVPPNVNQSDGDFAVVDGKICFGMAAIKGVGMAAGVCIAKARRADGPYTSLFDFCERVDPAVVNRTAIESLVKAGAFDAFGAARAALAASVDRAIQAGAAVHADRRSPPPICVISKACLSGLVERDLRMWRERIGKRRIHHGQIL
jgi:DNA polymerase-3 subunit alpha